MNQFNVILAVKNASKKFLNPERDQELYQKHFEKPMEKAAKLVGVELLHFGGSIKKITSTVRNLKMLEMLLKCKNYKQASSLLCTYSAILAPLVGIAADAIVKQLLVNGTIGPLVAAKVSFLVSAFSCGILVGFGLYVLFTAKELYGMHCEYMEAKEKVNDPHIQKQLEEVTESIDMLKNIELDVNDLFEKFNNLKENEMNTQTLYNQIFEKVSKATDVYKSTSEKVCKLNRQLKELMEKLVISHSNSDTTAKVSMGLSLVTGVSTLGLLMVPGVNLFVAGGLVAGQITAFAAGVTSASYATSFQSLVKEVSVLQKKLDGQSEEMDAIKERIDNVLQKADSLNTKKPGEEGFVDIDNEILNNPDFDE